MYSTRPNTVSLTSARDNRPAIKSGRGSDFNFAACGTDAFTATASNNLTDARWRICGIGSDAEQIESGVTKLITFFPPSLSLSFAHPIVHQFCPFSSLFRFAVSLSCNVVSRFYADSALERFDRPSPRRLCKSNVVIEVCPVERL